MSAAPSAIIGKMRRKYSRYWDAADSPVEYRWGGPCPPLPRLTPSQIREASASFAKKTAMAYDGWHVRHFGHVSDGGLRALAIIFEVIERSSRWPSQISLVTTPMIGKPKGGHRLVGKLSGAYRVWSKARRPFAEDWEARNDRPFFAAASGIGPVDAVYRQAMRQEAAGASGQAAATVLEDMEAFYETVDRELLLHEARVLGFPTCLVRASLATYAAPRMITHGRYASREVHPRRGIVAGCSFATTLVKVFYLRRLDALSREIPASVRIDAYIDDLALTAEGSKASVAADIVAAHGAMIRVLTRELHCGIARDKTAVVASHPDVGRRIAAELGQKDALAGSAVNLGTDVTAGGRRRRLGRAAKRTSRLRSGVVRGRRLWAISKVLGRRALKIFTSGIAPGMTYGGDVWGISDAEQVKLRRTASRAMRPKSRCRSLTAVNLLHGMPTASAEVSTAVQYSRVIWRAVVKRVHAAERGASLSDVRKMWEAAYEGIKEDVDTYVADMASNGGRASSAAARRSWGAVRGPIGAAAMTLARLGWRMADAFTWIDAYGVEVVLTKTPPAMIRHLLVQATLDAAEAAVGAKWAETDKEFVGRRVCPDIAAGLIERRCGGRLTAQQVGAYRAAVCGGIYTRRRAWLGGYEVEDVCDKCGAEGDTVHHRVYLCPHTRAEVLRAVPRWLYEEGRRASPASKFWTTGVFPHPAQTWPRPESEFKALVVGNESGSRGLDGWDCPSVGFGEHLYSDGSCAHHPIRGLARAGASSTQVDEDGRRVRAVYMPVPSSLPQTSQAGEHLGVALSRRMAARPAHVRCDCANVVKAANAPAAKALGPGRMYAGLLMDQYSRADAVSRGTKVGWVKAHRAEAEGMDAATLRDVRGNAAADALAGEAVGLHPQPTAGQRAELEFFLKRAPLIARAVGVALAMFPSAEQQRLRRREGPASAADARSRQQHYWSFSQGSWRCECCGTWARGDALTARQRAEHCRGHIAHKCAKAWSDNGHLIAMVAGDAPFAFCSRCGAWGNRRARKLMRPCVGPTPAGSQALQRIARGRHPWRRKLAGGGEAPRTSVKVTTVFDKAAARWRSMGTGASSGRRGSRHAANAVSGAAVTLSAGGTEGVAAGGIVALRAAPQGAAELPPSPADDPMIGVADDEDPFGHGGSLSQDSQPAGSAAAAASGAGGIVQAANVGEGRAMSAVTGVVGAARRARSGGEADARSRLEAVRRRVLGRLGAAAVPIERNAEMAGDVRADGREADQPGAIPRHLRVPHCHDAAAAHESYAEGGGGPQRSRSRAGNPDSHPRHPTYHRLGERRQRAEGQGQGIGAVRGHHAERRHHLWGMSSQCSLDPTTIPPSSRTEPARKGLVDLDGDPPPRHSSHLQAVPQRAEKLGVKNCDIGNLVGRGPARGAGASHGQARWDGNGWPEREATPEGGGSDGQRPEPRELAAALGGERPERRGPRLRHGDGVVLHAAPHKGAAGVDERLLRERMGGIAPPTGKRAWGAGPRCGSRESRGDAVHGEDEKHTEDDEDSARQPPRPLPAAARHRRDAQPVHLHDLPRPRERLQLLLPGHVEQRLRPHDRGGQGRYQDDERHRTHVTNVKIGDRGDMDRKRARRGSPKCDQPAQQGHSADHRLEEAGDVAMGGSPVRTKRELHRRQAMRIEGEHDSGDGVASPEYRGTAGGGRYGWREPARCHSARDRRGEPRGHEQRRHLHHHRHQGPGQSGQVRLTCPHRDHSQGEPNAHRTRAQLLLSLRRGGGSQTLPSRPDVEDGGKGTFGDKQREDDRGDAGLPRPPPRRGLGTREEATRPEVTHAGRSDDVEEVPRGGSAPHRADPVRDDGPGDARGRRLQCRGTAQHFRDHEAYNDADAGDLGLRDPVVPSTRAQLLRSLCLARGGQPCTHQGDNHMTVAESPERRITKDELRDAFSPSGSLPSVRHRRDASGIARGRHGSSLADEYASQADRVLTHHHHHDHASHSVREDERHHHYARHQSSMGQLRPSHHEAEFWSVGAHHIGRGNYGGRDSPPAIPRKPNLAAHGLERGR